MSFMSFAISGISTSPPENSVTYYLPNTLRDWPWERIITPNYTPVQAEAMAWLESLYSFTPKELITFNKVALSCGSYFMILEAYTDNLL